MTPRGFVTRCLLPGLLALLGAGCARQVAPPDDQPLRATDGYFPGGTWRTSSPEAQGIDSEVLVGLMKALETQRLPIHSLHLVRYGHLVLDAYFFPFQRDELHDIASITKSVTTTLVGLTLERGLLASLDTPVYPLLSANPPADPRKLQITLRHLLTTSSGLECGSHPFEREMLAMVASQDWVRFALDLPVREMPGTRFAYCSPGFHLLSALVSRATGSAAEDFAREKLFAPLGITEWRWPRDPQGINQGAGDLQIRPTDLLRLGYLFLRRGEWNGGQVIPSDWVAQATRPHVNTPGTERYGFGWWISTDIPGVYQGVGRGGQRLIVWPAKDVVVVTTGGGFDPALIAPFLLRSLKSNGALAANPKAHQQLRARVEKAARPMPTAASAQPLPPQAALISRVDFALRPNPLDVRGMQLQFISDSVAQVRFRLRDAEPLVPVGLDGVYRFDIDPATGNRMAGRGRWASPHQFVLEIDTISRINHFTFTLDFEDDAVKGRVTERAGLVRDLAIEGRAQR
jgi:CubicO group peptidase (beta-lactamase class C family)